MYSRKKGIYSKQKIKSACKRAVDIFEPLMNKFMARPLFIELWVQYLAYNSRYHNVFVLKGKFWCLKGLRSQCVENPFFLHFWQSRSPWKRMLYLLGWHRDSDLEVFGATPISKSFLVLSSLNLHGWCIWTKRHNMPNLGPVNLICWWMMRFLEQVKCLEQMSFHGHV